jgi:hypothetical protein
VAGLALVLQRGDVAGRDLDGLLVLGLGVIVQETAR